MSKLSLAICNTLHTHAPAGLYRILRSMTAKTRATQALWRVNCIPIRVRLRGRLRTIEKDLAEVEKRKQLANCNCKELTFADPFRVTEFKNEMNRPCPTHRFRDLGEIHRIQYVVAIDGRPDMSVPKDPKELDLERLLKVYEARRQGYLATRNTAKDRR